LVACLTSLALYISVYIYKQGEFMLPSLTPPDPRAWGITEESQCATVGGGGGGRAIFTPLPPYNKNNHWLCGGWRRAGDPECTERSLRAATTIPQDA
jgi:hypothetical protein